MTRPLMIISLLMLAVMAVTPGCARKVPLSPSYQAEGCSPAWIEMLAEHLGDELAAVFPPGHTNLFLQQTGKLEDAFGPALDQALRSRGFTMMAAEADDDALTLVYVLDRIEPEVWYTKLAFSNGMTLTRLYRAKGEALLIEGGARNSGAGSVNGQK